MQRPALDTPASDSFELLAARYGAHEAPPDLAWSDTIAQLLSHRSVRAYRPDPLPDGTLQTLVAAAQSAPSSSNLQTWSVIAVEDPARKARLAALARNQQHIIEAPLFLVWLADLARLGEIGRRKDAKTDALSYFETLLIGIIDAALAAQNAVVALESLGLGSVYIGALRNHPVDVAEVLGLPPNVVAVFGLCVGYADATRSSAVKPRLPQRVVVHRERYDATLPLDAIDGYDTALAEFQRRERVPDVGWTVPALERVRGPEALHGRDRIREALTRLGFDLR